MTPVPPVQARTQPTLLASAIRVFDLSLGQMLWSRRSVLLGVLVGGPVLLAIILTLLARTALGPPSVNGAAVGGATIFGLMIWILYIRVIVPILGVFYGTALLGIGRVNR